MIERTDPQLVKEVAREAKSLLDDRAFSAAVKTLHKQWLGELISDGADDQKVRDLVAKLRVLEAIAQRLASMMRDDQFAQGIRHGGRSG
jgi:hypothetical protein